MNDEEIEKMRSEYTGDCERPNSIEWMREQLKCMIENGTIKYCKDCDWLFPHDADHVLYITGPRPLKGEEDE